MAVDGTFHGGIQCAFIQLGQLHLVQQGARQCRVERTNQEAGPLHRVAIAQRRYPSHQAQLFQQFEEMAHGGALHRQARAQVGHIQQGAAACRQIVEGEQQVVNAAHPVQCRRVDRQRGAHQRAAQQGVRRRHAGVCADGGIAAQHQVIVKMRVQRPQFVGHGQEGAARPVEGFPQRARRIGSFA